MANPKPVTEVRIGRAKATIWRNGTEEHPRHNDLLVLAKVADQAHSRIFELSQEEAPEVES